MKQGKLVYDSETGRMDIQFEPDDYYGGLHCGTTMEVFIGEQWVPTRIEYASDWFLVGIKIPSLSDLKVRI